MKPFYISTSIAYANSTPHLGYAMESIEADAIARFARQQGRETFFLTGTDEHGIKIYKTAAEKGKTAKELVDENAARFQALREPLNLSNDDFIRTSDQAKHWPSVQKIWQQLEKNGDIFEKEYEGLYCEGCEAFYQEKDLVDGNCPNHLKPPVVLKEKNWFFRLSKYSDQIVKLFETGKIRIEPEFRQREFLAIAKEGLTDVSFSRPVSALPWGIPVPEDETQNMYVWCDALTNYISALGYKENSENFQKFWTNGEVVHVIGKDIVRFHAGIWIGMLLSAGMKLPDTILIHGFITSDGQKMSKSLGNVVDPFEMVEKYGTDALRYFVLREVPIGRDGDYTKQRFEESYTAHLANNLGNLLNRVVSMAKKYEISPQLVDGKDHQEEVAKMEKKIDAAMQTFSLNEAMDVIWETLSWANKRIDDDKPWSVAKTDPSALPAILSPIAELLRRSAIQLLPFLPTTSEKMLAVLGRSAEDSAPWGQASDWNTFGGAEILFPRIEES